ncbi:hypothetical protein HY493_05160 [Candidatus Woesearchaeota archaeon]|nr:hypothetical protein [Candidatus Woesearchaeota archaeon]
MTRWMILALLMFAGCASPQPLRESQQSPYLEQVSKEIDLGIIATLRVIEGIVVVNGKAADTGTPLREGDVVKTGLESRALIIYQDDTELAIPPDTEIIVRSKTG